MNLESFTHDFKIHRTKNYKPRKRRKPRRKKEERRKPSRKKVRRRRSTTKKKIHNVARPTKQSLELVDASSPMNLGLLWLSELEWGIGDGRQQQMWSPVMGSGWVMVVGLMAKGGQVSYCYAPSFIPILFRSGLIKMRMIWKKKLWKRDEIEWDLRGYR